MKTEVRTLLIGGVGTVRGRTRRAGPVMREICDEFEPALKHVEFAKDGPFQTISLVVKFGENTRIQPQFGPVNRRYSELPVSIEFSMEELNLLDREELKTRLTNATLCVLESTAKEFDLPYDEFLVALD